MTSLSTTNSKPSTSHNQEIFRTINDSSRKFGNGANVRLALNADRLIPSAQPCNNSWCAPSRPEEDVGIQEKDHPLDKERSHTRVFPSVVPWLYDMKLVRCKTHKYLLELQGGLTRTPVRKSRKVSLRRFSSANFSSVRPGLWG